VFAIKRDGILKRMERAMIRVMCGVKLMDRRNTEFYVNDSMLSLKESLDRVANASGIWWYCHVLRREEDSCSIKALQFELLGRRGRE